MYVIYYSHAKNTHRFVERHLLRALEEKGHEPWKIRVHASGPRGEIDKLEDESGAYPVDQLWIPAATDVLFVTPTYGKFNHKRHRAENFTPQPMRDVIKHVFESNDPFVSGATFNLAVGGNRTFGKDYAKQDFEHTKFLYWVGDFELSGTETEAERIVSNIR